MWMRLALWNKLRRKVTFVVDEGFLGGPDDEVMKMAIADSMKEPGSWCSSLMD